MNNKEKSFNKAEYDNNFQKENYDRIVIKVKKEKRKNQKHIQPILAIKMYQLLLKVL